MQKSDIRQFEMVVSGSVLIWPQDPFRSNDFSIVSRASVIRRMRDWEAGLLRTTYETGLKLYEIALVTSLRLKLRPEQDVHSIYFAEMSNGITRYLRLRIESLRSTKN